MRNLNILKEVILSNKGLKRKQYEQVIHEIIGIQTADIPLDADQSAFGGGLSVFNSSAQTAVFGSALKKYNSPIPSQSPLDLSQSPAFSAKTVRFGTELIKKVDSSIVQDAKKCIVFLLKSEEGCKDFQVPVLVISSSNLK